MLNGKKIIRIGLLGLFSCLFLTWNVHGDNVQILEKWEALTPTANWYNSTYLQWLTETWVYFLLKWTTYRNLIYWHYYLWWTSRDEFWFFCNTWWHEWFCRFMSWTNGNNLLYYNNRIYPYESRKTSTPSTTNCAATKQENFTWNVCYVKAREDFWEEYDWKFTWIYFRVNRQMQPCFIYEELNEIVCPNQYVSDFYWSTETYTFDSFDDTLVKNPSYITQEEEQEQDTPLIYTGTITNQHAIYAYEQLWITPQQCYWWYPIDTIYNTGTILYQWYQAWTGASILDLYNLYSWNYNWYQSTYMTEEQTKISQFLSENYQWYENNGLSFFIWKPEALITIIQQYNNGNQKATEKGRWYSLFQLYTYCDLLINHNNNEEYTGNTATPDMRRNGIDTENQEIVLPVTWSVFDELQQDWEFKRNKAQDVRDTINSVYTKLTKIFKLRWWVQGIIPDYITRILLLIILFAIFKK